jgi:hypothetical protein
MEAGGWKREVIEDTRQMKIIFNDLISRFYKDQKFFAQQ